MSRRGRREVSGMGAKVLRAAVATAVALTLILGVTLFAVSCGDSGPGPEDTVQQFLTAMQNQDIDTIMAITVSPEDLAAMEEAGVSADDVKSQMGEDVLGAFGALKFSDVTMESTQEGDEATVTITGGSVTVEAMGVTLDLMQAKEAGFPTDFYLYKVDGKWYLDLES